MFARTTHRVETAKTFRKVLFAETVADFCCVLREQIGDGVATADDSSVIEHKAGFYEPRSDTLRHSSVRRQK